MERKGESDKSMQAVWLDDYNQTLQLATVNWPTPFILKQELPTKCSCGKPYTVKHIIDRMQRPVPYSKGFPQCYKQKRPIWNNRFYLHYQLCEKNWPPIKAIGSLTYPTTEKLISPMQTNKIRFV